MQKCQSTFMPVRVLCLLVLTFITSQRHALAQTQKFAKGMVIYRATPSDKPPSYDGALYTSTNPVAAWVEYDVGQPRPLRLERGQVVREIDFANVFELDMTQDEHLASNQRVQSVLNEAAKESPKLSKISQAVVTAIQSQIEQYRREQVRYRGRWIDRSEYDKLTHLEKEDTNAILERRKNLKTAYPAAVTVPLLADFDVFTLRAGTLNNLLTMDNVTATATLNFGKLDASLKSRSKILPGSDSLNIVVGLYPSESADGPAVLWAAKEDNLLALDAGICIRYQQADMKLVNTEEIRQTKFFLSKFDDTIFDTIVDALAAAKLKSLLTPVTLSDNYLALQKKFYSGNGGAPKRDSVQLIGRLNTKKGEFTMLQKETSKFKSIFLIGKPTAMTDGTMRQFVIVQLR